ncbi:zinc finger protein castor homolog 1-like [Rhagoletis pomonella]|uniref:zinc finger protein castor homolog 1-like n=1 Tax=Rhagoletis pomonella TaxID=28610 RepID=UPI001786EBD2|nr:zinc finger protein castor homolog 1-like [Rhagoletis pomonella]
MPSPADIARTSSITFNATTNIVPSPSTPVPEVSPPSSFNTGTSKIAPSTFHASTSKITFNIATITLRPPPTSPSTPAPAMLYTSTSMVLCNNYKIQNSKNKNCYYCYVALFCNPRLIHFQPFIK